MKKSRFMAGITALLIAVSAFSLISCGKQEVKNDTEISSENNQKTDSDTKKEEAGTDDSESEIITESPDSVSSSEEEKEETKDTDDSDSSDTIVTEISVVTGKTTEELNNLAKQFFTNLQTYAQEYETNGIIINAVVSSDDDDSDYVNDVKSYFKNVPELVNIEWCADIKDINHQNWNTVQGVIVKDPTTGYCGAYPNRVPDNMNIPYSKDLLSYAADDHYDGSLWKNDFPECVTED